LSLCDLGIWEKCPGKKSVVNELTSACLDKALSPVARSDAHCSIPSGGGGSTGSLSYFLLFLHVFEKHVSSFQVLCYLPFYDIYSILSSPSILFLQVCTDLFKLSNPPFISPLNPFCRLPTLSQSNNLSLLTSPYTSLLLSLLFSSIIHRHCFCAFLR